MSVENLFATGERVLHKTTVVSADPKIVWKAWTTPDGIRSFFAPVGNIELQVHGKYEILFDASAEPGQRGAEDCIILAIQPEQLLSFTWSAPPHLPKARAQRTVVIVRLKSESDKRTRVTVTHVGWGDGGEWDQAFEYFDKAWEVVLFRLKWSCENGPVDWNNPPRPE